MIAPVALSFLARLKLFVSYYRPYRRVLMLDLLCAFVVAGVTLIFPLCAGYVTRTVLGGAGLGEVGPQALGDLTRVGLFMLGLVALHLGCNTFVDYQGHLMGTRMEGDMRRELFRHLQALPYSFHDAQRTGHLMSRLTNDLYQIGELAHHGPEDLLVALLKFVGVFVILGGTNVKLTLLLFAFLPVMALYAVFFNVRMNAALMGSRARIADVNAQAEDTLAGIRVVQSFTGEATEQRRFEAENARFIDSRRAEYRAEAFFYQGMTAFSQLMLIAVLAFGGLAILRGGLRLNELVTYLLCVGLLLEPVSRLVNISRLLQEGVTGFERFLELMAVVPDIRDAPQALELQGVRGEIEFQEVTFRYSPELPPALQDINLTIRAGEYVALVGASGVGKSTLCALIPRFYEVSGGRILLERHADHCADPGFSAAADRRGAAGRVSVRRNGARQHPLRMPGRQRGRGPGSRAAGRGARLH